MHKSISSRENQVFYMEDNDATTCESQSVGGYAIKGQNISTTIVMAVNN